MKKTSYFLLILLFSTFACKQKPGGEQVAAPDNSALQEMLAKLPPPFEVAARLQATGAEYNHAILSIPSNASALAADTNKNLVAGNLGIYLADMGYCIAYQQKDDAKQYYEAASQLAESLGLQKDFLSYLMKRYDQNLNNNDSLKSVLNDMYHQSVNSISGDNGQTLKGIVACANYIESLHTLMAIVETYPKDQLGDEHRNIILAPVFRVIFLQKENVQNVHNYLNAAIGNAPNMAYFNDAFNGLTQLYDSLNIEDKINNNKIEDLMNDTVIQHLIFSVENIRNKVMRPAGM